MEAVELAQLFTGDFLTIGIQLAVALVLGMFLGAERSIAHKTAGLRTYGLVSMGAALFVIASGTAAVHLAGETNLDLLRVISGIVTGVGFIGAGMIIFKDETHSVTGLTTAAGLWVAAGIGVAVGLKMYVLALLAALFTLVVFTVFWHVEHGIRKITNGSEK